MVEYDDFLYRSIVGDGEKGNLRDRLLEIPSAENITAIALADLERDYRIRTDVLNKSLSKMAKELHKFSKVAGEKLELENSNILHSRNIDILNKMSEIIEFLNECKLNGLEINTSVLDAIRFKPYNLSQLFINIKSYHNIAKTESNDQIFSEKRKEILECIPEVFEDKFTIWFPLVLNFKLATSDTSSGCLSDDAILAWWDHNPIEISTSVGKIEFVSGLLNKAKYIYVNGSGGNSMPINKTIKIPYINFKKNREWFEGWCYKKIKELAPNYDFKSEEYKKIIKIDRITQILCPADYYDDYIDPIINDIDFKQNFIKQYIEYLSQIYTQYSYALLDMKNQIYDAKLKKEKQEEEYNRIVRMDIIANPNSYTEEDIKKYLRSKK